MHKLTLCFLSAFLFIQCILPQNGICGTKFPNKDTFKNRQNNSFGTRHIANSSTYSNATAGSDFTMGNKIEQSNNNSTDEKNDYIIINTDVDIPYNKTK